MPKSPSEKTIEAEKLYKKGVPMVDIAKKLGVSDGTVRSWKSRYGWDEDPKKNKNNVAKKNATKKCNAEKKKVGAPLGNKNAVGGRGNPHPNPPPDTTKHGGYKQVKTDKLSDDELVLYEGSPDDEEEVLLEEIRILNVEERRLITAINNYIDTNGGGIGVAPSLLIRYKDRNGNIKETEEHAENKDLTYARLQQELSSVHSKRIKAAESLHKLRMDRLKAEGESIGSETVNDWISALTGVAYEQL